MIRVRLSRAISLYLFSAEVMLCALADWHRWRIRRALNLAFRWRQRDHCADCADWEAAQTPDPMAEYRFTRADPHEYRRSGLI